ncbi:hypothetical protein Hanom_Chr07g00596681 [Helianthus anomalus]
MKTLTTRFIFQFSCFNLPCFRIQCTHELEDMKKRLKEIGEEVGVLREMQAKVENEMGSAKGPSFILVIFVLCITMLLLYLPLLQKKGQNKLMDKQTI